MRDVGREISLFARPGPQSASASMAIHLVGDGTSPSMAAARGEAVEAVRVAIESMDPLDQEVLALRHFEELTNAEVAQVLGIQVKAASIRYMRALRRLKQLLGVPGLAERQGDGA
jgi:RNA polymerase sigma-70 factor (ECF subfamily)